MLSESDAGLILLPRSGQNHTEMKYTIVALVSESHFCGYDQGLNTNVCDFSTNSTPHAFNSALKTALSKSKKLKFELVVQ